MATRGPRPLQGDWRKRRIYGVLLPVAAGATVVGLALNIAYLGGDAFNSAVLAALAITLAALYLATRTPRIALWLIERVLLAVLAVAFGLLLWYDLYVLPLGPAAQGAALVLFAWLPLVFVTVFLALPDGLAVRFATGFLLFVVLLTFPHAMQTRGRGGVADGLILPVQLYLASGVLITALYFFSGFQKQIQQAEANAEAMRRLANTDALTGIGNRRATEDALLLEMRRAERYRRPLGFIIIDLDDFKGINDRLGHLAGDEALVTLAQRLGHMLRATDTVGRWGGEEFVIIAPETDLAATMRLAEVVRGYVSAHPLVGTAVVTASIGVAAYRPSDRLPTLIARADAALYLAKERGKDQVRSERDIDPVDAADRGVAVG